MYKIMLINYLIIVKLTENRKKLMRLQHRLVDLVHYPKLTSHFNTFLNFNQSLTLWTDTLSRHWKIHNIFVNYVVTKKYVAKNYLEAAAKIFDIFWQYSWWVYFCIFWRRVFNNKRPVKENYWNDLEQSIQWKENFNN